MEEQSVSIKEDLSNKQAHVSSDEGADSGGEKTDLIKSETGSIPFKLPSSPPPHSHHPNTEAEDKARGEAAAAILSLSSPKLDYKPPPWALEPSKTARYGVDVIKNGALVQSIDFASRSHATFVVIGRLASCDIHLEHPSISRYHCVLQYGEDMMGKTGQGWHMYDLGSTHRSKLNKRQVPSKQYLRVRVGHVMQFGGSTRIMMLTGPSTDTDQEWECSPTEMRQKKERQKLDIKLHKEAEKDIIKDKHNDEEGISWGMDYSEEEAYVHAVEGELGEEREAAYRDDPLKALGHFFDREGFDLLFTFSESGSAHTHKWTCHIELPVDTAAGQSLSASATCTGSKKEAEVLCALNACKTLDMHGVLYRSRNEARRKASNLAENDFYDSDEDTYLDRTGQIEKNRESRRKRALEWKGESSEVKETYEGLVKKIAKAHEEIKGLEERLEGLSKKDSTKEGPGEDDELDAFYRNLERTPSAVENSKKKTEISQLRQRLMALKHETERNEKLAKIAKPVALPSLKTSTSSTSSKAGNGGTTGGSSVSISTMNKLLMKRRSKAAQRDKEMGMELPPVSSNPEETPFVAEEDDDDTQTPPSDPLGSQHKPLKDITDQKPAGNLVEDKSSKDSVQRKLEAGGTEANVDELQPEHSTGFTENANAKAREDQPKQHGAEISSDSSIKNAKSLVGGSGLDSSKAADGKTQKSEETQNLEDSHMVANLLRLFRIVQVSPASTNADLSDKSRFEYFARTVPSDNYQARAMIDIAQHFNWTYVSLVYSADEYGELGAEAFKKEARKVNICIAIEERILNKKEALSESIDNLVKKLQPDKVVGARAVVLFVGTEYVPELMLQTAERMNLHGGGKKKKKIIWLASEGWDRNNDAYTVGPRKAAAEGAIVLILESKRVPPFEEYFLSLNPGSDKFERNKWLRELWQHKFNCDFGLPEGSTLNRCENQRQTRENFSPDDKVQFVIDAVFAIAHGLQAMKQAVCPNDTIETSWISRHSKMPHICSAMEHIDGEEFYQKYLLHVRFDDPVGKKFRFSPEGDGPAHYTILNYQPSFRDERSEGDSGRSEYVEVGRWSGDQLELDDDKMWWSDGEVPVSQCSMPCRLGYRKQLIKLDEICCWACGKCDDYEYLINETTCVDCGQGWWPTADRTGCFDLARKHLKHMRWSSWYSIVPAIFAVIGICCTIAVIIVYMRYNETPVVKASGRELSYILLASMLMCYAMTFILISRPTAIVCAIKRTGIGFAFSCLYAAMLVKTNRIARIFSQSSLSAQRPSCISPISQLVLTALLAGVQLFGSLTWLFIVPPGTRHDYPSRDQVVLTCNVPDHHFLYSLAYDAALIVLCTVYAVKTRKVPENFNETKFIGFSMYTTCVVWLSWIFFFFGTGSDFQIQTTSLCISISMSANVALVCIFSPKLYIILFEKHKNVRKQDGEYMLSRRQLHPVSSSSSSKCCGQQSIQANETLRSAVSAHEENTATQYTALLADQRRRGSTRSSHQSISSSAHDTFL